MLERKIRIVGSSYVVTIPKQLVEAYGMKDKDIIIIKLNPDGSITLKKKDIQKDI